MSDFDNIIQKRKDHLHECLKDYKSKGLLSDATLTSGQTTNNKMAKKYPCHRVVLAASSSDIQRKMATAKPIKNFEVYVKDVKPEVLEDLHRFLYNDKFVVKETNCSALLHLGSEEQYRFKYLRETILLSDYYISNRIDNNSVIEAAECSLLYDSDKKWELFAYIRNNFEEIFKNRNGSTKTISLEGMLAILKTGEIKVNDEILVFQTLVNFIEKEISDKGIEVKESTLVNSCLDLIRWEKIEKNVLKKGILYDKLETILKKIEVHTIGKRHFQNITTHLDKSDYDHEKRFKRLAFIDSDFNLNVSARTLYAFQNFGKLEHFTRDTIIGEDGNDLLLIGCKGNGSICKVKVGNSVETKCITEFSPLSEIIKFGITVQKNTLLIVGGLNSQTNTINSDMYSYDFSTTEWKTINQTEFKSTVHPVVVSHEGYVYVLGGVMDEDENPVKDGNYTKESRGKRFQSYHIASNKWSSLAKIPTTISSLEGGAIVRENKIHIIKPFAYHVYDIKERKWDDPLKTPLGLPNCVSIHPMHFKDRFLFACCALFDESIFLIYDPRLNDWSVCTFPIYKMLNSRSSMPITLNVNKDQYLASHY